jgi:hypothetical protein
VLLHYWHFNTLPTGTLTTVNADLDLIAGGVITYPGTGAGYMDNVDPGSTLNARSSAVAGLGLRPRNPADTRDLVIVSPTTGYEKIIVSFAVMRSGSGSTTEEFYYSTDQGVTYTKFGTAYAVEVDYTLKTFDLSAITALANNSKAQFKVKFTSTEASGTSGNNRFDNIAVEGTAMTVIPDKPSELMTYWNFNTLPTGTLTSVAADFAKVGTPTITYPGTGAGFLDNVNPGSDLNLRQSALLGLGLRVRNPSDTRDLVITSPSTGYKKLVVTYAVERTSSGADLELFQYSADGGVTWVDVGTTYAPTTEPTFSIKTIDLTAITAVNNNANLQFRIRFSGALASGTSGNHRFDNFAIDGVPL